MEWVTSHPIPSREILRYGEVKRRYVCLQEKSPSMVAGIVPSPGSQHCAVRAPHHPAVAINQTHCYTAKTLSVTEM